jgi:hypothetical protein
MNLLQVPPSRRIAAIAALQHPWFSCVDLPVLPLHPKWTSGPIIDNASPRSSAGSGVRQLAGGRREDGGCFQGVVAGGDRDGGVGQRWTIDHDVWERCVAASVSGVEHGSL